ncbi:MAG: regulator of ime2 [Thelocarpon impressellum]|nr:MAG: regulator of ime2 [Thelocarpon impressellum]
MSPTSIYSTADAYVPARAAWGGDGNRMRTPLNTVLEPSGGSDISAVELPTPQGRHGDPTHTRVGSGEMYYEDVDPRFAQTDSHVLSEMPSTVSPSLPPVGHARSGGQHLHPIMTRGSYEDLPDGARSPAASDTSHYTSVSQRGVNPNWPGQAGDISSRRPAPQQQQRDMLFAGNNDFELPGAGRARGGGRGGRMPALMPAPLAAAGGRYPGPNQI